MDHHKKLATPIDSSTSRLNESIYAYVLRELYGTNMSMWKHEIKRIKTQHGSDCPVLAYILLNKMFW